MTSSRTPDVLGKKPLNAQVRTRGCGLALLSLAIVAREKSWTEEFFIWSLNSFRHFACLADFVVDDDLFLNGVDHVVAEYVDIFVLVVAVSSSFPNDLNNNDDSDSTFFRLVLAVVLDNRCDCLPFRPFTLACSCCIVLAPVLILRNV